MLQSLNLKHIYYFWVVAREKSIFNASKILNVSSSSISEQIKTLESRIGVDLFDRSQKKMILSPPGKDVFQKLDQVFPQIDEVFESLVNHKNTDVKLLKIGFCPTLSKEVRFRLCFSLIEDPHYTVMVNQGENRYLMEAFNAEEIDLFFSTNAHLRLRGNYKKKLVGKKKFTLVSNNRVASVADGAQGINILHNQKFINYTADSEHHFKIYRLLNRSKIHPIRVAEIDDINLIKQTLQELECFAILPENSIVDEIKSKKLVSYECNLDKLNTEVVAFYKMRFHEERFIQHLKNISLDFSTH